MVWNHQLVYIQAVYIMDYSYPYSIIQIQYNIRKASGNDRMWNSESLHQPKRSGSMFFYQKEMIGKDWNLNLQ